MHSTNLKYGTETQLKFYCEQSSAFCLMKVKTVLANVYYIFGTIKWL